MNRHAQIIKRLLDASSEVTLFLEIPRMPLCYPTQSEDIWTLGDKWRLTQVHLTVDLVSLKLLPRYFLSFFCIRGQWCII